jgi:hypothetical protein
LPDYPDFIANKLTERQEWEWANQFHERRFPKWERWLEREGIEYAEVLPRTESRNTIYRRFQKLGLKEEFREWRREIKKKMVGMKYAQKVFTNRSANELSYWLVPFYEIEKAPLVTVDTDILSEQEASHLPADSRWCYFHPGLCYACDEDMPDEVKAKVREYERRFPCPHQGALNKYLTFRGDKKQRESFLKDCDRLYFESVRKGQQTDPEKEQADAELERLDELMKRAKDFA